MEIKSSLPVVYRGGSQPESGYSTGAPEDPSGSPLKHRPPAAAVSASSTGDIVEIGGWHSRQISVRSDRQDTADGAGRNGSPLSGNDGYGATGRIAGRPEAVYDGGQGYNTYDNTGRVQPSHKTADSIKWLIIDVWA